MPIAQQIQKIERPGYSIELYMPDAREVMAGYYRQKEMYQGIPFPYWTKLWASSLAMADWLYQHPEFVENKNVLELAAGLGLPSMVAAKFAGSVVCSDYLEEAVHTIKNSVQHLHLDNVQVELLNWNNLPEDISAEILLLSDINYETEQFDQLHKVLMRFLQQGSKILLTTPQRLMAKPFIGKLLPYCISQSESEVEYLGETTVISVFVLEGRL